LRVTIIDALGDIWTKILEVTALFITPDWNAIIGMLPLLILLGVVGPFVTFTMLGMLIYQVRKPRTKVEFEEGPRFAEIGADGNPIFPPGLPHCRRHGLIYPSGVTRCEREGELLAVTCPMCGLGRDAEIETCTNCGLVLKVKSRAIAIRTSGPRPGGAAAA
jgi:hypothetical protein